jgi:hypothetical protein
MSNQKTARNAVTVFAVLVIALVAFIAFGSSNSSNSISAKLSLSKVVDPSTVHVEFTLTNAGTTKATTHCTIHVTSKVDPTQGSNSSDYSVDAKSTHYFYMDVPVSNRSAALITTTELVCS